MSFLPVVEGPETFVLHRGIALVKVLMSSALTRPLPPPVLVLSSAGAVMIAT